MQTGSETSRSFAGHLVTGCIQDLFSADRTQPLFVGATWKEIPGRVSFKSREGMEEVVEMYHGNISLRSGLLAVCNLYTLSRMADSSENQKKR